MRSKVIRTASLTVMILAGCSLRVNDEAKKPETKVDSGTGCLSTAGDVIQKFNAGTLSESEHAAYFACMGKALDTFAEFVEGKNQDYFEPEELGGFLTKYFLNGKTIQPALMLEAMALKSALIGGDPRHLSREDMRSLGKVFQHLKQLTGRLRPIMPVAFPSLRQRTPAEFAASMRTFIDSLNEFGENMKGRQGGYSFDHLGALAKELRDFMYGDNPPEGNWTSMLVKLSQALRPAKAIFIAPPRDELRPEDWLMFYHQLPRYYAAYLRVEYYTLSPTATMHGAGLRTMEGLFDDFLANFGYLLDQHPGQKITSEEIDDLLKTFHENGLLPCTPETARQFVRSLFGKFLGESDPVKFAITRDSLSRLATNVRFLFEGWRATEALYRVKFGENFQDGTLTPADMNQVSNEELLKATRYGDALSKEAVESLKLTPSDMRTVFGGSDFLVTVPKSGENVTFNYHHSMKAHGLRSFNRLLIHAYGNPAGNRLSEEQFGKFADDIFPMLIEMGLVDESMRASIAKRLFEASLFLPASDGDKGLTMSELLELEAVLVSVLENSPKVHQQLANLCKTTKLDENKRPLIAGECYREKFLNTIPEVWKHVPGIVDFLAERPPADRLAVFERMAHFLRKGHTIADDFTVTDTQAFVLLPYYVEFIFMRFDRNRDGKLVNAEGDIAYSIFQPFIAAKAGEKGFNNPKDHKAIFNFLLAYRTLPDDDKWAYVIRRYLLGPKKYSVDRAQVVEIFEKLLSF